MTKAYRTEFKTVKRHQKRRVSCHSCQVLSTKNSWGISTTPKTYSYQPLNTETRRICEKICIHFRSKEGWKDVTSINNCYINTRKELDWSWKGTKLLKLKFNHGIFHPTWNMIISWNETILLLESLKLLHQNIINCSAEMKTQQIHLIRKCVDLRRENVLSFLLPLSCKISWILIFLQIWKFQTFSTTSPSFIKS